MAEVWRYRRSSARPKRFTIKHGGTVATRYVISQQPCNPSMLEDRGDRISSRGWCGWCSNDGICSIAMRRKCEEAPFQRSGGVPVDRVGQQFLIARC